MRRCVVWLLVAGALAVWPVGAHAAAVAVVNPFVSTLGSSWTLHNAAAVVSTATVNSLLLDQRGSAHFGVWYQCTSASSAPDVTITYHEAPTTESTELVSAVTIHTNLTAETPQLKNLAALPMGYGRVVILGNAGNPADTLCTVTVFATAAAWDVAGASGGAASDVNLSQYGGTAVGATNAVHVQPGTGATWAVTGPLTDAQLRATAVPISGTVTATGPLTDAQLRATAVPVSGTVTASGGALEASLVKLPLAQGSTTSGQSGPLMQAAVLTVAPTYTNGQTSPVTQTTAGAVRTDASATTQPVSGTIGATQSGTWNVGTLTTLTNMPCAYAEDVAHVGGEVGCLVLAVRNDTPVALAGTTLDRIPFTTDSKGQLWVTSDNVFTVQGRTQTIKTFTVADADGAKTDSALVTTTSGVLTVNYAMVSCSPATTGTIAWRLGFAAATLPAEAFAGEAGVFHSGWFNATGSQGMQSPFTGTMSGAAGEDIRLTIGDPVSGACKVALAWTED